MKAIEIYRKEKRDKPGGFDFALQIVLDRAGVDGIRSLLDAMLVNRNMEFSEREIDTCISFFKCIQAIEEKYQLIERVASVPKQTN